MAAEARLVPENGLRVDSTGAQGVVWAMGFRTRRHSASGSPWLERSIDISGAVSSVVGASVVIYVYIANLCNRHLTDFNKFTFQSTSVPSKVAI